MTGTVLLVDDSPTARSLMKVYLSGDGLDFIDAGDGERALEILKARRVSLVIADVHMPKMDGVKFVTFVRALNDPDIKKVPIILLTADKTDDTRTRGLDAGANEVLQKPVSSANLLEAVRHHLTVPKRAVTRP
jgi:two-component system chemotaxis response regulator CheY